MANSAYLCHMVYALIDCNNFFASCETVFYPPYRTRPLVVLSNNDGCVIARSAEARRYIQMGEPVFKCRDRIAQHRIVVRSSNYSLYGDISARVMSILSEYSPDFEVYSIDEAFLRLESHQHLEQLSHQIRERIDREVGISISIGLAATKTLAKVANRIAKKFPEKCGGVYHISDDDQRIKALKWLDIEDVWGIGRRYATKLKAYGISKAWHFAQRSESEIKQLMKIWGVRLKYELNGIAMLGLEMPTQRKQIAVTRTLKTDTEDWNLLHERIVAFASVAAQKLRKQQAVAESVTVFVISNRFKSNQRYYNSHTAQLHFQSQSSITIAKTASKALETLKREGVAIKKIGIILSQISPAKGRTISLFDTNDSQHDQLMQTMDKLQGRFPDIPIQLATQNAQPTWDMRREHLSPNYTTQWEAILNVK